MKVTLVGLAAFASALGASARAQSTELASISSAGTQGNQFSRHASLSADGRFVVFDGPATNLVAGDTNNQDDVFLRDRQTGVTSRVSVATGGVQLSGYSQNARLSADGRFVVFESGAPDAVPNDTNAALDIFVHDRQTGVTSRVSVSSLGAQAGGASYAPSISADGRFVAFHSAASNLVTGDTNNAWDVFVHDRQLATTTRVSRSSAGLQASGSSSNASISADGRFVAFQSGASNLVTGDTNAAWDIFVRDLLSGTTTRVSVSAGAVQGNASSVNPALSADGSTVAFHSAASNLVPNDANALEDVFVHVRATGATERASEADGGGDADNISRYASLSGDGRFVAFESTATNVFAGDANARSDVFVHDRMLNTTAMASVSSAGAQGDEGSYGGWVAAWSRTVVFDSYASTLVAVDANNTGDAFVHTLALSAPHTYCTAGTTSHGCVPSISASGTPSASAPSGFTLSVTAVEGLSSGLIFYGTHGGVALPWASGSTSFYCVKAPTERTPLQAAGGTLFSCDGAFSIDFLAYLAAHPIALGQPVGVGDLFCAQAWFRDPPAPKTTNLSDAVEFEFGL